MNKGRVAVLVVGAVIVVFGIVMALIAFGSLSSGGDPSPSPSASSATPTPTPTPTPTATVDSTPTPTPTASPSATSEAAAATCENTATTEFLTMMSEQQWQGWTIPRDGIGFTPFDDLPGGPPPGQITCRWGEDPDLATDNVVQHSWSALSAVDVGAWQSELVARGYERIDSAEGVFYAVQGEAGYSDDEGFGDAYLFTDDDVRWAMFKADVAFVKAPDDAG